MVQEARGDEGALQRNSTACTDQIRSNHGAFIFALQDPSATDYGFDIDVHTAQLTPGGVACGGFGADGQRHVGQSDEAILWTVLTFDGDLNPLGEIGDITDTSVDDVITLTGDAALFEICARNTSQETATLSFDVL